MPQSSASRRTRWASSARLDVAEAGGRLVEQQHARLGGDGPGDGQQPALAVGQVLHRAQQVVFEAELADRRDDLAGQRRVDRVHEVAQVRPAVARVGRGAQVVEHGGVLEQLQRLERPAETRRGPAWPARGAMSSTAVEQ